MDRRRDIKKGGIKMKEKTVYICEKCGMEFPQQYPEGYDLCQEHEKTHINPIGYDPVKAISFQPTDTYPSYIRVRMTDGEMRGYWIDPMIEEPTEAKEKPSATGNSIEG